MKICAIICEYNPFHNGHLYQIREIQARKEFDAILCLMSGNFAQRGEAAILEKRVRAKHALLAGADVVIELPTLFATSPAELFAKGAVHILSAIPSVTTLCFGAEFADKETFIRAAKLLNNEPKSVSDAIKQGLDSGLSYAKARSLAWQDRIPMEVFTNPNTILGVEYTKAIIASNANIDILPLQRTGSGYKDEALSVYSSATAIRKAIVEGTSLSNEAPSYVLEDLPTALDTSLEMLEKLALLQNTPDKIAKVCDCSEGLENALKRAANSPLSLVESVTSARYTSSRIRRIALQNLLEIEETQIRECLTNPLYLRVLALRKDKKELLSKLREGLPLLLRAHDEDALSPVAKQCWERDIYAERIYSLLYPNASKTQTLIQ